MAFPQTPLAVLVELFVSGAWQDITRDVYVRDRITITRGRSDEGARTDPGKCTLTLNNGSSKAAPGIAGRYWPRNPLSDLYGKIGRNTPLRVSVNAGSAYLQTVGNSDGVSTPDAAALRVTGDIDIRVEVQLDNWARAGQVELCGKYDFPSSKAWILYLDNGKPSLLWSADGTTTVAWQINTLPSPPPSGRMALRATLDVDNGAGGATLTFYTAPSINGPWTPLQAGFVIAGTTSIAASTGALYVGAVSNTAFLDPAGRFYAFQLRNGIDGALVAAADFTAQTPGAAGFTSGGLTWTVRGAASLSNRRIRFVGEVSSWLPRWDVSGKDVYVSVEAAGVLRRYGQGAKALDSTLRRRIPSGSPLAYWPLEDGANAVQAAAAVAGVRPLTVSGLSFASDDTLFGSSALPALGSTAFLDGRVPRARAGGWHTEMVYKLAAMPANERTIMSLTLTPGTGGVAQVLARVSTAGIRVQGLDSDGNVVANVLFTDAGAIAAFTGVWNRLQIFSSVSGSTTNISVAWRDVVTGIYWYAYTFYTGTPGTITGVRGSWDSNLQGMALGHLAVWDVGGSAATTPGITIYDGSDDGFQGETAGARMLRLATEEGLPLSVYGTRAAEERVGPQRPDILLTLLEDAADVDGGILYEQRESVGLAYRDRVTLYNQTPALELDYTQPGHVAPPLEPVDDDAGVRNDRTVQRAGGSSARAVLDTGSMSVQAPPNGIGVYDDSTTLNLYTDDQTGPQAYWRLALGTVDEARYPVVNLDLAAAPSLIDQVTALDSGDRGRIANPPPWLPPGPIDLIMQGYQETIGHPNDWDFQLNCTPASPWTVAEVAVVEGFETTTAAVAITSGGNLPWTRSQVHYNAGVWSLKSGAIGNNQTSDAIVAVPPGSTELTFWYYTSSESSGPGFEGDRLLVLVDGVQVLRAQGTTPWTSATIPITGATAVTFRYAKDNSGTGGEDGVWIDDLTFVRRAGMRADTGGAQLAAAATSIATTLSVATTGGQPWVTSTARPEEFPFDVLVGGERMRVTAITGASSPQTFTVVRSRNGIVKPLPAGADVRLAHPAVIAL